MWKTTLFCDERGGLMKVFGIMDKVVKERKRVANLKKGIPYVSMEYPDLLFIISKYTASSFNQAKTGTSHAISAAVYIEKRLDPASLIDLDVIVKLHLLQRSTYYSSRLIKRYVNQQCDDLHYLEHLMQSEEGDVQSKKGSHSLTREFMARIVEIQLSRNGRLADTKL